MTASGLDEKTVAWNEGTACARAGLPRAACPYPEGSGTRHSWERGWDVTSDKSVVNMPTATEKSC